MLGMQDVHLDRAKGSGVKKPVCSGLAASWCPIHGDCKCLREESGQAPSLDGRDCPLHGPASDHNERAEDNQGMSAHEAELAALREQLRVVNERAHAAESTLRRIESDGAR